MSVKNFQDDLKSIPTVSPEFAKRLSYRQKAKHQSVWSLLDGVFDPELPGLTIWDIGILQDVLLRDEWTILITPTYSGCPAVDIITQDIVSLMNENGYNNVDVRVVLSPAWTTDMISPAGIAYLKKLGIAPPEKNGVVECPVCHRTTTTLISQFGSTACKALYRCENCLEVFDYFKCF